MPGVAKILSRHAMKEAEGIAYTLDARRIVLE
jgi:hypothetical protein